MSDYQTGRRIAGLSLAALAYTALAAAIGCAGGPGAAAGKAEAAYLIRGVHVISGTGSEIHGADVLIRGGKIERVSMERLDAGDAELIDGAGKTLMPGLIDAHLHIQGFSYTDDRQSDAFRLKTVPRLLHDLVAKGGVTTIRDMGEVERFAFKLREDVRSGRVVSPELLVVGPNITSAGGHADADMGSINPYLNTGRGLAMVVRTADEARGTVSRLSGLGADFIKICYHSGPSSGFPGVTLSKFDKDVVAALVDESRRRGLRVAVHTNNESEVREILDFDIAEIEHGVADKPIEDASIPELFVRKGVYFVPTLQIFAIGDKDSFIRHNVPNLRRLHAAGVKIALGTDMMAEIQAPDTVHDELAYYVEAGLSPMEALQAGTRNAAECLGILNRTGTVEEGKEADLLLLDADPLVDIANSRRIAKVFMDGRLVAPRPVAAKPEMAPYAFAHRSYAFADNSEAAFKGAGERRYEAGEGGSLRVAHSQGGVDGVVETLTLGPDLETKAWSFERASDGASLKAAREGGIVRVTGTYKGRAVDKAFPLESAYWLQAFPFDLAGFVVSGAKELRYKNIGTSEQGGLGMATFVAKRIGMETIDVGGTRRACVKVSEEIPGFPLLHGLSWHDPETGVLVRFGFKEARLDLLVATD